MNVHEEEVRKSWRKHRRHLYLLRISIVPTPFSRPASFLHQTCTVPGSYLPGSWLADRMAGQLRLRFGLRYRFQFRFWFRFWFQFWFQFQLWSRFWFRFRFLVPVPVAVLVLVLVPV